MSGNAESVMMALERESVWLCCVSNPEGEQSCAHTHSTCIYSAVRSVGIGDGDAQVRSGVFWSKQAEGGCMWGTGEVFSAETQSVSTCDGET